MRTYTNPTIADRYNYAEAQRRSADVLALQTPRNREIMEDYRRSKRLAGVSDLTIKTYLYNLLSLLRYCNNQDLDTITRQQIEDWYLQYIRTPTRMQHKPPTQSSINTSIRVIRNVLAHIHGEHTANEMLSGIKLRCAVTPVREESLLTAEEIQQMLRACTNERDRAIIALLYASGCRLGELVSLRIRDVVLSRVGASLHLSGKTGERDVDIFSGVPELKSWLNVHPLRDVPDAPLFVSLKIDGTSKNPATRYPPLRHNGVGAMLIRVATLAGIPEEKRFNAHSFRHKRATDLADHLTTADLRVMFGWSDTSNTPNIYVHSSRRKVRAKLAEIAGITVPESVAPSAALVRQCPNCGCINSATDAWCSNCHAPLTEQLQHTEKRVEEFLLNH